ncbi:MAG TPA: metallophosphoesterase, partial [Mobilitalea sp.]|nr:metallophosphoesterase [Mobilitalea sp.]
HRLLDRIDKLAPDMIIVAGDMITKYQPSIPSSAYSLMEELVKKYPVYYAYGNHEQYLESLLDKDYLTDKNKRRNAADLEKARQQNKLLFATWSDYLERLKAMGVIFLDNTGYTITKNNSKLRISGVSIEHKYFEHFELPDMEKVYLSSLVENTDNAYQILIAHNPLYFKNYAEWGADLVLSGHLHGGIVRLPGIGGIVSPQVNFFPKYDSGSFTLNDTKMVVSRGLGTHSIMLRMFNRPELVFITLKNS